jgi:apolipoprotein N-acyltransferase
MARPLLPTPFVAVAALLAGGVAALGFAPWDLWPLTVAGVALLFGLVDSAASRRRAAWLGWLFGTAHFSVGLGWIATAFTFQDKMPAWLGWVAVVGLAMFLALYIALAAGLARALPWRGAARVLALAALWMLGEWLRGWVLTGFAWNPLGAAWLALPGIRQLAQFGGALALSAIMVIAGGALWLLIARPRAAGLALLGGVAALALVGTRWEAPPAPSTGPIVHLVQPNIGQDERYVPGSQEAHLRNYLALTAEALARRQSPAGEIAIWSEGSVPWLVEEEPDVRAALAGVLGPDDLLLFGGTAAVRDAGGALVALGNSLFAINARAEIVARFDKAHLVPLGEYVPLRPVMTALGLARLVPGDLEFQPGPGPMTVKLPGFPAAGMMICYEIIFPGAVVDRRNRPAWIVNVSNDAWYGPSGPPQHLAQARLRAIEEGLPIARATPTGISAMIDGHGNVIGALPLATRGVASVALPPALPPTLFARAGHLATLGLGLVLLAAALLLGRRGGVA